MLRAAGVDTQNIQSHYERGHETGRNKDKYSNTDKLSLFILQGFWTF
jgi:hypothetical protein